MGGAPRPRSVSPPLIGGRRAQRGLVLQRRSRAMLSARLLLPGSAPFSMLHAALTTARCGPRLSRLLSAAATSAVPAPNHQPEVFCNQVRLAAASSGPRAGRSGRRGLSFPSAPRDLGARLPLPIWPHWVVSRLGTVLGLFIPHRCSQLLPGAVLGSPRRPSRPSSSLLDLPDSCKPKPEFRSKSWVRTSLWPLLPKLDFGMLS